MKLTAISSIYSLIPYRNIKLSYDNVSKWIHGWILNYQIRMDKKSLHRFNYYYLFALVTFHTRYTMWALSKEKQNSYNHYFEMITTQKSEAVLLFLFFFLLYLVYQYQFLLQYISLVKFESCRTNNTYI